MFVYRHLHCLGKLIGIYVSSSSYLQPSSWRQQAFPQARLLPSHDQISFKQLASVSSQTDEERQQALQAFAAQSFLGAAQHTASSSGSGSSGHVFSSPISALEHRAKIKRVPRKTQNEKYRLKYLRLRKAARAFIFVSEPLILGEPVCSRHLQRFTSQCLCVQENAALCDEVAHLEEKFLKAKEERR